MSPTCAEASTARNWRTQIVAAVGNPNNAWRPLVRREIVAMALTPLWRETIPEKRRSTPKGTLRSDNKKAALEGAAFFELVAGAGFEPTTFRL